MHEEGAPEVTQVQTHNDCACSVHVEKESGLGMLVFPMSISFFSWEKNAGWSEGLAAMLSMCCIFIVVCSSISWTRSGVAQCEVLLTEEHAVGH